MKNSKICVKAKQRVVGDLLNQATNVDALNHHRISINRGMQEVRRPGFSLAHPPFGGEGKAGPGRLRTMDSGGNANRTTANRSRRNQVASF